MNFNEFKNTINTIESADELQGWEFDRFLTTLQNVVLNLDKIQSHINNGIDRINGILDK